MINEFIGNRNFKLVLCQNDLCEAILRLVVWEVICYELSSWYLLGSFDFTPVETLACSPSLSFCHSSGQATCPRESAKSGSLLDSWILDLQIYAVTPIPESQEVLQREGVPDNIKSFYKVNHIWKFRYDRPFHKGTKDPSCSRTSGYTAASARNALSHLPLVQPTPLIPWIPV